LYSQCSKEKKSSGALKPPMVWTRSTGKKQNNNSNIAKNFWSEYDGREANYTVDIFTDLINKTFLDNVPTLRDLCLSSPGQPPEQITSSLG
jgi:hypothetical protein